MKLEKDAKLYWKQWMRFILKNKPTSSFYFILISSSLLFSCKEKEDTKKVYQAYEKNNSSCNRILIFSQDSVNGYYDEEHLNYSLFDYHPFNNKEIYEVTRTTKQFDSLLKTGKKTGYCCCPKTNYKISFYDSTYEFDKYLVDTISINDKVIIYQKSFQFSYHIDKNDWNKFLKNSKQLSFKEYKTSDLVKARRVYELSKKNNLPIITANNTSIEWMNFNGSFDAEIISNEIEFENDDLENIIKKKYPHYKFEIEEEAIDVEHNQNDDLVESKIQVTVYCNEDFYKVFNIFKTKKYKYIKSDAQFCVIGTKDELENFEEKLLNDN